MAAASRAGSNEVQETDHSSFIISISMPFSTHLFSLAFRAIPVFSVACGIDRSRTQTFNFTTENTEIAQRRNSN